MMDDENKGLFQYFLFLIIWLYNPLYSCVFHIYSNILIQTHNMSTNFVSSIINLVYENTECLQRNHGRSSDNMQESCCSRKNNSQINLSTAITQSTRIIEFRFWCLRLQMLKNQENQEEKETDSRHAQTPS